MPISVFASLLASLALAACTAVPPPALTPLGPADPANYIIDTHYHSIVNYVHREPIDPRNWRRLNDDLSKGAGS